MNVPDLFEHQTSSQQTLVKQRKLVQTKTNTPKSELVILEKCFPKEKAHFYGLKREQIAQISECVFFGWNHPFIKRGFKKKNTYKVEEPIEILLGKGSRGSICQRKFRNHTSIFQRVLFQPQGMVYRHPLSSIQHPLEDPGTNTS